MTNSTSPVLFPVRIVVQRTGLSADVLRAWERRYGAVVPTRTPGGQRVYSERDIGRLTTLARLVERGHSIGRIAQADEEELARIEARDARMTAPLPMEPAVATEGGDSLLAAALEATERMDDAGLERLLRTAALRLGVDEMLEQVLAPLLFTIGSLWHQGALRPANEHMATAIIRRTLGWMIDGASTAPGAPLVLVATPAGQQHELGAMIAAASLVTHGVRVLYLGVNLPADDIAEAAKERGAAAVALSVVFPGDDPALPPEITRLRTALPRHVPIFVGGASAAHYATTWNTVGALMVDSLDRLRAYIRGLPSSS